MDQTACNIVRSFSQAVKRYIEMRKIAMSEFFSFHGEREGILEQVKAYLQSCGGQSHRVFIATGTGIPYGVLCRAIRNDAGQTMKTDCQGVVRLNGTRVARRKAHERRSK